MPQRTDTDTRRTWRPHQARRPLSALAVAALLASVSAAQAAADPEQKCQKGRYDAAAKYNQCQQKVMGKFFAGSYMDYFAGSYPDYTGKFLPALSKCRVKYTDTWATLQAKATGTGVTCDNDRYDDNGDGTVTDRLTGLQWEQKTDDNVTVHDKDNLYSWSATSPYTAADGTAFTSFLATLNSSGCFAGQCDWRLPTIYELQTILLEPYPCGTSPCIDPVFGPTVANRYWSASTYATSPDGAWIVGFFNGDVNLIYKGFNSYVRAVRAGL